MFFFMTNKAYLFIFFKDQASIFPNKLTIIEQENETVTFGANSLFFFKVLEKGARQAHHHLISRSFQCAILKNQAVKQHLFCTDDWIDLLLVRIQKPNFQAEMNYTNGPPKEPFI